MDYLCGKELDNEWKDNLAATFRDGRNTIDLKKIGGFSLLYGKLSINPQTGKIHHLNILSNRGDQGKVFKSKETSKDNANGEINLSSDTDMRVMIYLIRQHLDYQIHYIINHGIKSNWENHY